MSDFATTVARWQKKHGRHGLPWQQDSDPYKVWLSEIMLQQTQVAAVIPYYENFLRRFPTLAALARARTDSVLAAWSGLGYYARARHLHAAAKHMQRHGIPSSVDGWLALPGVGKSTAAAVAVFAHNQRHAILDGNVKRILARAHLLAQPINSPAAEKELWQLANALLPDKRHIRPYTQGMMDIGATLCKRQKPLCAACPLAAAHCRAHAKGLTAEYPRRRAKKEKPEKTAHFILIHCEGKVLLQRQPPRGIWGGLWSLPPFGGGAAHWRRALGCRLRAAGALSFTHEFTHYRLRAAVSAYRASATPAIAAPLRWHGAFKRIGMPAPVRKLLENMPLD